MDGKRFDAATQRLESIRLTRGSAPRRVAASALTLAGLVSVAEEASAAKKRYCAFENATDTCATARATGKARKQYLEDHPCSYSGTCQGSGSHNPCKDARVAIDMDLQLFGILCPLGSECSDVNTTGLQCVVGGGGIRGGCLPPTCPNFVKICISGNDAQCCAVNADCVGSICQRPLDQLS